MRDSGDRCSAMCDGGDRCDSSASRDSIMMGEYDCYLILCYSDIIIIRDSADH